MIVCAALETKIAGVLILSFRVSTKTIKLFAHGNRIVVWLFTRTNTVSCVRRPWEKKWFAILNACLPYAPRGNICLYFGGKWKRGLILEVYTCNTTCNQHAALFCIECLPNNKLGKVCNRGPVNELIYYFLIVSTFWAQECLTGKPAYPSRRLHFPHFVNLPAQTFIDCHWISATNTGRVYIHKMQLMVIANGTWS